MATSLTPSATETRRAQEPTSDPMRSNQGEEPYDGQHRSAGEKAHCKRRANNQAELGPPSDGPRFMQGEHRTKKLEDHNVQGASENYARKLRHKTKPDRYQYKDASKKPPKNRALKGRIKKKSATLLNHEFQAPNVAIERLTLNSNSGPGFLAKGKSSTDVGKRGLPDLTFSEMAFLKRKRRDDHARFGKVKQQNQRKKGRKSPNQEISEFFSPPTGWRREGKCLRNPHSTDSYVSCSVSPPQKRAPLLTYRLLSPVTQSNRSENGARLHEAHCLIAPSMVRPTSSAANTFLEGFTTDALLHGIGEFAHGGKRYYSLHDLKKLAAQADSNLASDERPRHDIAAVCNVNASTSYLQASIHPSREVKDSPCRKDCNNLRPDLPSVQPSNNRRALSRPGSDKQDLNRMTLCTSAALEQLVNPTCYPRPFWEGFVEKPESSCRVHHSRDRVGDGELSLYADGNLELQGYATGVAQSDVPPPERPATAGNFMNETEALQTIAPFSGELDEFDRKLLRFGAKLAQSASAAMVDRESDLYKVEVEKPLRDVGGYWRESWVGSAVDRHRAHASFGSRDMHDVIPMNSYMFHDGQELSEPNRHVPQDPTDGFSGFSRRHVLY
ncbi:uncharacterized protein Z519_06995 [Cladophialophora bantiana CBS 173.52]|uniref:Uncharacterized protein n=1 Tax=Cladophialophora bantiana (strain ATCC 10958 / CBS 173.52 / CDC B-1940 / NIH 8579) TaxID=1442370 RepID=A0A0D2HFL4_CLAB1|nr:uncharacterized protein Z519_06995 [Cladophialophora bantiana CBS 173.52]KIW92013.1 hypothetical protein Z519_06995 [Cladophialophora bantiana CBS 173.52]